MYKHVNSYISQDVIDDIRIQLSGENELHLYQMWLVKVLGLCEYDDLVDETRDYFRPEDIEDRYRDVYAHIDNENYKQAKLEISMLPIDDPETITVDNLLFFKMH